MVVGAGHPFGGSLSEAFTADCVAVLLCCTAPGVASSRTVKAADQKLERSQVRGVHRPSRRRLSGMRVHR